jgi:CHRD domain
MRKLFVTVLLGLATLAVAVTGGAAMSPVVSAKLSGKNEAPAKGDPDGAGLVILHLNAKKGTACWEFKAVRRIGTPQAAHIHKGRKGKAGPVYVPLGGAYRAKGCQKASRRAIEAIETRPNDFYVNIHNARYPNGALRGQLVVGMTG